jgi:hypothetical protein
MPIQRVPSGLPGPGGTGSELFAHGDGGGYHHGFRCMFTTSYVPRGVGYEACPVATGNHRTSFTSSKRRSRLDARRITIAWSNSADVTFGFSVT